MVSVPSTPPSSSPLPPHLDPFPFQLSLETSRLLKDNDQITYNEENKHKIRLGQEKWTWEGTRIRDVPHLHTQESHQNTKHIQTLSLTRKPRFHKARSLKLKATVRASQPYPAEEAMESLVFNPDIHPLNYFPTKQTLIYRVFCILGMERRIEKITKWTYIGDCFKMKLSRW